MFLVIVVFILIIILSIYYTIRKEKHYRVIEIPNLLTIEECDELIEYAKQKDLQNSKVSEEKNVYNKKHRESKQIWVDKKENAIIKKLSDTSILLTGIPYHNQELVQIVRYTTGGMYNKHYDSSDKIDRVTTLLVYLNDSFTGGETEFPLLNKKIKPQKGKGVLFYNLDSNNNIIKESLHAGNPIKNGEKWIANVWSHRNVIIK